MFNAIGFALWMCQLNKILQWLWQYLWIFVCVLRDICKNVRVRNLVWQCLRLMTGVAGFLQWAASPRALDQGEACRPGELLDHDCVPPVGGAGHPDKDAGKDAPSRGEQTLGEGEMLQLYFSYDGVRVVDRPVICAYS